MAGYHDQVRVLCLADIHATEHPPSACTDAYWPDILDLLRQSVVIAAARQVDAVAWAGDVFHHKGPARTSHRLVLQLIRIINDYPCPVYIVPGNHDMQNDREASIIKTQPLGVLYERGARRLEGWAAPGLHFSRQEYFPLYGVPWQQQWDDEHVFAALRAYTQERSSPVLVATHAPLYPPGRELPYENFPAEQWAVAMGGKGSCFYGHVHEPHGVYKVGGVTFCNYGALSRGSLHEYNLTRQVGVTVWDSSDGSFDFIPLEAKPAGEVFRLAERGEEADRQGRLDEFLAGISSATLGVVSTESVMELIRARGISPAAEALVEELLAEAGT